MSAVYIERILVVLDLRYGINFLLDDVKSARSLPRRLKR